MLTSPIWVLGSDDYASTCASCAKCIQVSENLFDDLFGGECAACHYEALPLIVEAVVVSLRKGMWQVIYLVYDGIDRALQWLWFIRYYHVKYKQCLV